MSSKALLKVGLPIHEFSPSLPIHGLLLVSGAGGGFHGPAGVYDQLRHHLTHNSHYPIVTVQMDYRRPADLKMSVEDIVDTMKYMKDKYHISTVTLMGWSFGGAVVISGAGQVMLNNKTNHLYSINHYSDQYHEPDHPSITSINAIPKTPIVRGIITLGSQTYGTDAIHHLHQADIHCLFMHGKADTCLSPSCSEQLYRHYKGSKKQLLLYKNDDHGCSQHTQDVIQRVSSFIENILYTDNNPKISSSNTISSSRADENIPPNNQVS
jgi:hypothetical protein